MNHFIISAFATFVATFFMSTFFVFSPVVKERLFGLYWTSIAFWSFTVAFQYQLLRYVPAQIWGWFLHLGCLFVPAIFLHFVVEYTGGRHNLRAVVKASYLLTVAYLLLNTFSNLFTLGTSYRDNYAYPTPRVLYPVYFVSFVMMVTYGTILLFRHGMNYSAKSRKWILVFLIIHCLAYLGAMDNFLIMADIRLFPLYPFGLYLVFPYALLGGYSIYRLRECIART